MITIDESSMHIKKIAICIASSYLVCCCAGNIIGSEKEMQPCVTTTTAPIEIARKKWKAPSCKSHKAEKPQYVEFNSTSPDNPFLVLLTTYTTPLHKDKYDNSPNAIPH